MTTIGRSRIGVWGGGLLWVLPMLFASPPPEAAARGTRTAAARAYSGSVQVGVRYGHGYRPDRPYRQPSRHHHFYRPYWRPYYAYYPWHWWGWGGFWLGPAPQRVYLVTHPAPGLVETDVKPKKAEVWVDGEAVGQARDYNGTWDRLALPPGRHTIEFRAPGFMKLSVELDVDAGSRHRFAQKLEKGEGVDPRSAALPAVAEVAKEGSHDAAGETPSTEVGRGFLHVRVEPADAVVYLDGEFLAVADELSRLHGALALASGRRVIEVVRPGHRTARIELDVQDEGSERVEIRLEPE